MLVIDTSAVISPLPKIPFLKQQKMFNFDQKIPSLAGMVLPKCWIGLAWVIAFYGCVAQTQALLSEDELIR